ncbi:MAG: hypothetical protein IKH22_03680 [Prevotella sp.]|nr:hypothetical protein [Prevotella sp.]
MTETNPLELLNEINGIVERIQWNRSAIPMSSSHQSASFHHFICQSFSLYLPIFFTLFANFFQETCQEAFPPSPSASHSPPNPVPPEIRMIHDAFMVIHAHYMKRRQQTKR